MVSASVTTSSEAWAVPTQVLFAHVRPLVSYGVTCSETLPMRKLPTGEPYARKPHVRFAGRGGDSLPDPYRTKPRSRSGDLREHLPQRVEDPGDLAFCDDQRRRERDDVARHADEEPRLIGRDQRLIGAAAGRAGTRLELDAGDEAEIADVDHMRGVAQPVGRVLPDRGELGGACEEAFLLVDVERCDSRCASGR